MSYNLVLDRLQSLVFQLCVFDSPLRQTVDKRLSAKNKEFTIENRVNEVKPKDAALIFGISERAAYPYVKTLKLLHSCFSKEINSQTIQSTLAIGLALKALLENSKRRKAKRLETEPILQKWKKTHTHILGIN
jgi:uncharacterized protein with ParB-like and HNH nuclease domain